MKSLYYHKFKTTLGWFHTLESDRGLVHINFGDLTEDRFLQGMDKKYRQCEIIIGGKENAKAEKQLKAYLAGKLRKFNLRLDIQGTDFQKKVLRKVAAIPYGTVATYGEIAARAGHPGASRAVGSVNRNNPLAPVIPCHRVVAANGLGGYGGGYGEGLKMKRRLLRLEGVDKYEKG